MNALRTIGAAAAAAVAVLTVACGGSEPAKTETMAAAPAAPAVKTTEQRVDRYKECWDLFNKRSWDAFQNCYAEGARSENMGSGQPAISGRQAVLAETKKLVESFPDMAGGPHVILANRDQVVSLSQTNGTNSGPMAGPDGKMMPATNKTFGVLRGHVVRWNAVGDQAENEQWYADTATMLGQFGMTKMPTRPVLAKHDMAPVVAIASGSETETKNVEAFRAQMESFNKHDLKGVETYNAADAVFHDLTAVKDTDGRGNSAALKEFFTAFSDCHLVTTSLWGAGDYVVAQGTFEGTNDGLSRSMGIRKATKKTVKVPFLEITRYEGGKIKDDWVVFESMSFAQQLGLM